MAKRKQQPTQMPTRQDFDALVKAANGGSEEALDSLRTLLNDVPEIGRQVGDMFAYAKASLIKLIAKDNQLLIESLRRTVDEMEVELLGNDASRLERMAVQRIVATWLELQFTDTVHPEPQGKSLAQVKFSLDLKNSAQRRFDGALKSLSLVRKMLPSKAAAGKDAKSAELPRVISFSSPDRTRRADLCGQHKNIEGPAEPTKKLRNAQ
ncbi:MAG: hypothetical protein ABI614_10440 [Planctomycetota bacterium]